MEPDIVELPKREQTEHVTDSSFSYLLDILSYLSCTIYGMDDSKND